jgi:hypothetical protein
MIVYIYINEKEKHDAMKLSEEEAIVEEIVKKHPYQGKGCLNNNNNQSRMENDDIS